MEGLEDLASDKLIEVPVSALEHFSYRPRQRALIHVEQRSALHLIDRPGED